VSECERALKRLTAAIASGHGDLPPLVAALDAQQRRQADLQARLDMARQPAPVFDATQIRTQLESYLSDWQTLLLGHVHQAQAIVRRLMLGRVTNDSGGGHLSRVELLHVHGTWHGEAVAGRPDT
jgi:hypothetical protein